MPLSSLVDKVLESKAKELLPKISEVVDKLRESKTPSTPDKPSCSQSSGAAVENNTVEMTSKVKPTDFGSLPLPIDILGLSSSTTGQGISLGTKREPSDGKAQLKSKSKTSENVGTKEGSKTKGKPTHVKPHTTVKEGSKREKDIVSDKDTTTEEAGKEKDKHKSKQKKTKDDFKDKGADPQKDRSQPVIVDKPELESHTNNKSEKIVQQEQTSNSKKESGQVKGENGDVDDIVQNDPKGLGPRRSARIASLSESIEDAAAVNDDKDSDEPDEKKERPHNGHKNPGEGQVKTKRKRKRRGVKNESEKKRPRILSSSSEEDQDLSCEEESDQGTLSDDLRKINKRKSTETGNQLQSEATSKKSRKRANHKVPKEDNPPGLPQKKPRRLSRQGKESSTTHTEQVSEPLPAENIHKPHRRKSSQPQRLPVRASKSPPVIVTRYNRQIKPNRRYLDPSGDEDNEETDLDNEAREETQNVQQAKDVDYSDIDSNDETIT